ncbi:MAG: hypothetical protein ACI8P9_003137, partial [Parasphingorhabdus sp.]
MTWAQQLKRVFNINIETCQTCGGPMKVIASIEDPVVIKQIRDLLENRREYQNAIQLPESGAP